MSERDAGYAKGFDDGCKFTEITKGIREKKVKQSYWQLTDEGKRQLMRDLSHELSDKMIAELIDRFADGVKLDSTGEPFIKIDREDVLICAVPLYTHFIDINHVEKVTANEEDYE